MISTLKKGISIILPAYNEAGIIENSLKQIVQFITDIQLDAEIILVNDGSTDETEQNALQFAKKHQNIKILTRTENRGKGYSVKQGVQEATGDFIIFTDSDLPYELEAIQEMIKELEKNNDIVIGSRRLQNSKTLQIPPLYRRIASRLSGFIIQKLYLHEISDSQCGLKGFKKDIALDLFKNLKSEGFIFDVELLLIALKKGYHIKEVPVTLRMTRRSTLRLTKDLLQTVREVTQIQRRDS